VRRRRQAPAAASPAPRARPRAGTARRWWWGWRGLLLAGLALAGLAALVIGEVRLHQPPQPDAGALRAAIAAHRTGTEVTFDGTVVTEPASDGGHQRMLVRDALGDTVELDYNVSVGRIVPVHRGDPVEVHGQLYVDPGQAGVHCLHAVTSRGCPEPGWIRFRGETYS